MRDYISVGSDKDYVRVPLTPIAARKIADEYYMMLPTAKIVDEIYKSASVHLNPVSMKPGPRMASWTTLFAIIVSSSLVLPVLIQSSTRLPSCWSQKGCRRKPKTSFQPRSRCDLRMASRRGFSHPATQYRSRYTLPRLQSWCPTDLSKCTTRWSTCGSRELGTRSQSQSAGNI